MSSRKIWNAFRPGYVAGSVRVVMLIKEEDTQAATLYHTRTLCCSKLVVLNHKQIVERRRRGNKSCMDCAKTREWKTKKKKGKRTEHMNETAVWPAPDEHVGRHWHGKDT